MAPQPCYIYLEENKLDAYFTFKDRLGKRQDWLYPLREKSLRFPNLVIKKELIRAPWE
jgi:hypothetical protein